MKRTYLLFFLLAIICCNSKKNDYAQVREAHQQKLLYWEQMPEPYYYRIPDSMRKWIPVFKRVLIDDQRYRNSRAGISVAEGRAQRALDSQNLVTVTSFLDKYGWPKTLNAGYFGRMAIGMTIQHAPLHIQERYFSMLVNAFKQDRLLAETLALLEDRINMRRKRYQNFGTQAVPYKGKAVLYPVYNPDSVDSRRRRLGLVQNLGEYLKLLQIDWNVEEYRKLLPELINEFNITDTTRLNHENF